MKKLLNKKTILIASLLNTLPALAQTNYSATTPRSVPSTLEAELFSYKSGGELNCGGTCWGLYSNGYVQTPVSFPQSGTYTFTVQGFSSYAGGGWANVQILVDGQSKANGWISSSSPTSRSFSVYVAAGSRQVRLAFTNDYRDSSADRNLWLDKLVIAAPAGTASPSPTIAPSPSATPSPTPVVSTAPCGLTGYSRIVKVSTASALSNALSAAMPGDLIHLQDGTYPGVFKITRSGTTAQKIALCGSRNAVLHGGGYTNGGFLLTLNASDWVLKGFTVTQRNQGIEVQRGTRNTLDGLQVHQIGQEAIHLKVFSTYNVVQNCYLHDTGKNTAEYGEGVYIGSAKSQWCTYTGCNPDRSDYNRVLNNQIGPNVAAEAVDVKEGTTGGLIQGNSFDGTGMIMSKDWVDAWLEIKGNQYTVDSNRGKNSLRDGYQAYSVLTGWGSGNVFSNNTADVGASGYGYRITSSGNTFRCSNTSTRAGSGNTNLSACE